MARMRVHELAKELNMNNKDLIDRIFKLGIQVKNHMSTLTESTVEKIRQQFAEDKTETVEEKRIGRAIIRRRKKTAEEEAPPVEAQAEPAEVQMPSPVEEPPSPTQVPLETVQEAVAEVPVEPAQPAPSEASALLRPAEPPVVMEPPTQEAPEVRPAPSAPPAEAAAAPEVSSAAPSEEEMAPQAEEKPVLPEPEAEEVQARPREAEVIPEAVPTEVAGKEMPGEMPAEVAAEPALPVEAIEPEEEQAGEAAGADAEASEDEEGAAAKKSKKRRRKKARKDEPARIIKLPEVIIPAEPEEEPELPPIAPRLQVKAAVVEDVEAKEATRKKKAKGIEEPVPAKPAKEVVDRKRKGPQRKEVFVREDLYSKKELAAQADRGRGGRGRERYVPEEPPVEPAVAKVGKKKIKIDEAITVANLSKQMGQKAGEVIKKLLMLGLPASINQALDFDTAAVVAGEFDFEVEKVGFEEEEVLQTQEDRQEDLVPRPPVITVMGHVDHGKTSLLDAIRHTNVISGEAGGITQHIGAYDVQLENGHVVFLDTPGHEAFTSMRARGAKVTDIVILLVAADDGVMQQTVEAINHAKAAEVPIIVAINKIDKPNANIERTRRQLADHGLIPGEWGGDTTMVEISAKKKIGIEELLEMVLLQAELLELKANRNKPARGRVIESKLDKGRGPVATILIQEGTLKAGDIYVCGVNSGRVRNMFNDRGKRLEEAGPSTPVEVLGFSGVPNAGDQFIVLTDEKQAKLVAEHRSVKLREKELTRTSKVTLESLFDQIRDGEIKELNVILKTDVHGSQEAIADSLLKLSTPEVKVNLIHNATGAITETDIMLAAASNAIVIGFNVRGDAKTMELAEQENVDVRYYDIIYQLLSDIRDAMVGMLEPVYQEQVMGRAEVRQTFQVPKIGMIAGSYVLDGKVERGAKVRVLRDQVVVYDGKVGSLRRFKEDAKEVKAGFECGIGIDNFNDIKVNDILEVYELKEVKPTLEGEGDKKA